VSRPALAFAGEHGSFGEDAALAYLPDAQLQAVPAFRDVFRAVSNGEVDGGVVPIENVGSGTVFEVYDLLLANDLTIVGEIEVPVRLCLAALPGQSLTDITRIYSHAQALSQAEPFLSARDWSLLASTTTASAGAAIARNREMGVAAVLSPRAAELYRLEILAADIQSMTRNRTRFLALAREQQPDWAPRSAGGATAPTRSTLCFGVANEPGTLLRVLEVFARHDLNMSKLESRPSRCRDWEYVFWVDLDADLCLPTAAPVVTELQAVTVEMRVFGCSPAASR